MDKKVNILIIGASKGGSALIELFRKEPEVNICGVVDINDDAPGMKLARELGLPTGKDFRQFLKISGLNTVIDVTANPEVEKSLRKLIPSGVELLEGLSAKMIWLMAERKEKEIIEGEKTIRKLTDDRKAILNILEDAEEANRQLKETQMKLIQSDKMAAIGQLAGGISHEINNPMGVILGFAQSIMKRIEQNNPLYMPLSSIEREAVRCKNLVQSLLTFSRTSGIAKTSMEINQTIEETLVLIEHQAKIQNVEIIKKFAPDLPVIIANRNQIQQVLMNLSTNAFDAMPQGGKLEISTELVKGENGKSEIEIKVSDTGAGIPEEIKHRIFEPFFTTKEPGKGTGLGLSLCYEIVQKHNGTIDFESEKDKGTTFTIRLPIVEEFTEKEKKRILVVDDDRAIVNQIIHILKKSPEKYVFTSATDGFRAGQALLEFNPDLIILDLMLPGIDGFQVCRNIRGNERTKQTKILAITGYDSPENREKIFAYGADGYLAKPFTIEELTQQIGCLINKK